MSNSTQNDEIKQMERAIDEGFAESERDLKNRQTPLDTPTQNDEIEVDGETYVKWDTQNDWEKRFYDKFPCLMHFRPNKRSYGYSEVGDDVKEFIAKELADARREGFLEGEAHTLSFCDCDKCRNYKRLATLREEEKYKESVNKMKKQFNVND